ncbi:hypothetical protein [Sphingomonas sp. SCN 67-18]|uniref:hypothetical protein n=1 Tax=uncultured Sphingomonas sp. TaxID=158754 RepID=UPI0025D7B5CA|nr:hypothetical protein [Sphingomonas sp. SCN 67-18]
MTRPDFPRSGLVTGQPEHRLSGEQVLRAGANHAASSRSSDGSGPLLSRIDVIPTLYKLAAVAFVAGCASWIGGVL